MDSRQPITPQNSHAVAPLSQPSFGYRIFFGRFGMRAGWGMFVFITTWFLFAQYIGTIVAVGASGQFQSVIQQQPRADSETQAWAQAHPGQPMPNSIRPRIQIDFVPSYVAVEKAIIFFALLGVAWILSHAESRHLGWFGLGRSRLSDFLPGALWGLAALSLLVFVLKSLHLLYFDQRLLSGSALVVYTLKWLVAFLFVGFAEEYFLRGYLQYTLTRGVFGLAEKISPPNARAIAFWSAAVLLSIAFACLHLGNNGENFLGIVMVFIVGMVFAYALFRTGSLWWAVGFHMAWDWAQSFLYGVPDSGNLSVGRLLQTHFAGKPLLSGGSDGPEGSLLCIPVLLMLLFVIRFTTRPGKPPPLEALR